MNNCVLCCRESDKLLCLSCGSKSSSSSCENCGAENLGVCRECYDKYRILKAIETLQGMEPFNFDDFKDEEELGSLLFWILLREGFIKKHVSGGGNGFIKNQGLNSFRTLYVLSEKCDDFMELNLGFKSAAESLLRAAVRPEEFMNEPYDSPGDEPHPEKLNDDLRTQEAGPDGDPNALKTGAILENEPVHHTKAEETDQTIAKEAPAAESHQRKDLLPKVPVSGLELCSGCQKELETETEMSQGICRECSRRLYALESLERILTIFEAGDEIKVDVYTAGMDDVERTEFTAMIWILEEFNLLEQDGESGTCRLKPEGEVQKFIIENVELKGLRSELEEPSRTESTASSEEGELECSVCREVKPATEFNSSDGTSPMCRECSRRRCAADALAEIRKLVEPGVEFAVDDIIENEDERFIITGHIWLLQDFDLIESNPAFETYTLKPDEELRAFHEAYGEGELVTESDMIRTCPICGRKLKKSSFYSTIDGKRDECRECYDRILAWDIFRNIREVVGEGPFRREELAEHFDEPGTLDAGIWTLQEHDLIEEGPEGFLLKHNPEIEEIYLQYHGSDAEETLDTLTVKPEETPVTGIEQEITAEPVPSEDTAHRKEIIYINPTGESLNLMMNGLVSGNGLMDTMNELGDLLPSMKKCMILRNDECFELLIELTVEKESLDDILGVLEAMNWENRVRKNS
ncbi:MULTISPECIES: hypothetical protein [Methanothermobacter]|uniref:Uncharacterized protein n=1 Tax=Methanothermobacter marburgensis (strain ATCC BAA-927 / DSM 2133 / JCM 14651 / NBRC 100331 / OCM 82 / Marburg) TaxID=79929 RepID=D9PVU5_METTM|nr:MULTISPECIES: hypothetical protein [Methanothermobacter]ADL58343.1 conserved hypothetical protein [Methanothermobacter marburgensis str. Marburg]